MNISCYYGLITVYLIVSSLIEVRVLGLTDIYNLIQIISHANISYILSAQCSLIPKIGKSALLKSCQFFFHNRLGLP